MIKPLALVILIIIGIAGTVYAATNSTIWKSFGYDVIDFVASFHATEGDAEYNPNLDVYKDGMINTMDVLKDRYDQEASRTAQSSDSADLSNIINELDQTEESSESAN